MDETFARCASRIVSREGHGAAMDAEKLRDTLLACQNPLTCPFGNAIYFEVPFAAMDRRFGTRCQHSKAT
jgi:hypothetical protein